MSNVKEFFTKENSHKVFLCNMYGQSEPVKLQCYYDIDDGVIGAYLWDDCNNIGDYINEISSVIEEVLFEDDFNDDLQLQTEDEVKYLESKLVYDDIYEYNSNDELKEIIKSLHVHVIEGYQNSSYGLLYYYSEYDDFACYGDGYTHYIKIIDKARIV